MVRKSQIRQDNGLVNGCQAVHGLNLDNNPGFDKEIKSISALELCFSIDNRNRHLPVDPQLTRAELVDEAFLIGGLQQARSKSPMNLDSRADNCVRYFVVCH